MDNPILQYYQAITDGTVVAGYWIKLFYQYVVDGLGAGRFVYNAKKARKAIRFIESFCHHCEGRCDLLKLELWQRAIVAVMFGVYGRDGYRQFREIVIVVARKNGKSLFAAAIIAYCLILDGEYGAKIYCVAPKLAQADLVYSAFWQTVKSEPELAAMIKSRKSDYYLAATNSSVTKIAFNSKKSDGFNPHLTVCDEIASWPGEQGLKQYEVMKSAMGARRQPLILSISTSGYINDGIYDELIRRSTRFLLGDSQETRLAPFLYMIDDVTRWDNIAELQKSNPNLGVSVSANYLLEEIAVAHGSLSKRAEFLTKYANIKQNASVAWLAAEDVTAITGPQQQLSDFRNSYCVGGIDLSRTTDLTACVVVIERDGVLYVFAQFFLPRNKLEVATERDGLPYGTYVSRGLLTLSGDNFVDYKDCYHWFTRLIEEYQIYPLQIGYDRYTAQYLVQDLSSYGFHMDDVFQGFNLTPVIQELEGIVKDRKIYIGDNDLLKVHLLNSAVRLEAQTGRCKLIKIRGQDRIDGTAALLDAMTVRQKWYKDIGQQLKNEG
jgi:phage terminase large subunit-like protein